VGYAFSQEENGSVKQGDLIKKIIRKRKETK
jgi:hypothetical protein